MPFKTQDMKQLSIIGRLVKNILVLLLVFLISACGPSQKEKQEVASVACAVMGASKKNLDAAFRIEKINEARIKIGGEPFLDGDQVLQEAFEYGLCEQLIVNENYETLLQEARSTVALAKQRERDVELAERKAQILEESRVAISKETQGFYPNGDIKFVAEVKPNQPDEELMKQSWYRPGIIVWRMVDIRSDGRHHGLRIVLDENMVPIERANFLNGEEILTP